MSLKLEQAETILNVAKAKAQEIGVPVCLVIMDTGANLKALLRMDGAWLGATDVATKKARTAMLFEAETQAIWDVCKPDAQAHGLETTNGGLVTFAGGIPLKTADGRLLGSIGVSGGAVAQDYEIARAGLEALLTLI